MGNLQIGACRFLRSKARCGCGGTKSFPENDAPQRTAPIALYLHWIGYDSDILTDLAGTLDEFSPVALSLV
jgi:hypothetical protein